jgi:DNA gyrase subunit A
MVIQANPPIPTPIRDELRTSYLNYAMSVIVSRALPDARDGLKPVQRRILYAMDETGMGPNASHKKSARLVGEVLGKYHPHGDSSVYDAMVRMAQGFSMRYPLVDGQGNFGSIDNDPPAAMRYTETRLTAIAQQLLEDLDRGTVDFTPNFDESLREPTVLPALLPNLLVNGASGIAVGMATNIPPHNLREVCDALVYLIDHPEYRREDLTPEEEDDLYDHLLSFIHGPDFPTGGIIMGGADLSEIREAYKTGHGRFLTRGKAEIETVGKTGRQQIVITEIPYQLNKASMVEKIAALAREKKIEGITDIRDESDRSGLRVVVDVRGSVDPRYVLSNLYEHTQLQSAFNMNMLALVDGQPQVLNLHQVLIYFIDFRVQVVTRRAQFDLKKAQDRAHILEGLRIAVNELDAVIEIIRASDDVESARGSLITRFDLTEIQANAILDMQLRRLTALDRQRLEQEYGELQSTIQGLESLLADPQQVLAEIKRELQKLQQDFGDARRTVVAEEMARRIDRAELERHEDVVLTLSRNTYIKRVPVDTYRLQHRGGKGVSGMTTREDDVVMHMLVADTHDTLLFFTQRGQVFSLICYDVRGDTSRTSRGTPLVNLIPSLPATDRVTAVVAVPELRQTRNSFLVLATRKGEIKRVPLERFAAIRSSGIIAMDLEPGDELIAARPVFDGNEVIVVSERGMSVCFPVSDLRIRSRTAGGVRAIRLKPGDQVVAADVLVPDGRLLTVSKKGFGKLTKLDQFRRQARGGSGVIALKVDNRTGPLVAARVVTGNEELVIASAKAQVHRTSLTEVSEFGRYARGVWIMRFTDDDEITSVSTMAPSSTQDLARVADLDSPRSAAQPTLDLPGTNGDAANGAAPPLPAPEEVEEPEDADEPEDQEEGEE